MVPRGLADLSYDCANVSRTSFIPGFLCSFFPPFSSSFPFSLSFCICLFVSPCLYILLSLYSIPLFFSCPPLCLSTSLAFSLTPACAACPTCSASLLFISPTLPPARLSFLSHHLPRIDFFLPPFNLIFLLSPSFSFLQSSPPPTPRQATCCTSLHRVSMQASQPASQLTSQ